jgi:hypothetical protein
VGEGRREKEEKQKRILSSKINGSEKQAEKQKSNNSFPVFLDSKDFLHAVNTKIMPTSTILYRPARM